MQMLTEVSSVQQEKIDKCLIMLNSNKKTLSKFIEESPIADKCLVVLKIEVENDTSTFRYSIVKKTEKLWNSMADACPLVVQFDKNCNYKKELIMFIDISNNGENFGTLTYIERDAVCIKSK